VEETWRCVEAILTAAYIERLNATRFVPGPAGPTYPCGGVHKQGALEAGMWLVGLATTSAGRIEAYAKNAPPMSRPVGGGSSALRLKRRA
jgi:hypothetical protein